MSKSEGTADTPGADLLTGAAPATSVEPVDAARNIRLLLGAVVAAGLLSVVLAGSAAGERTTVVGFAVRGNPAASVTVAPGKVISFVAKTSMRRGDALLIVTLRGKETKLRSVKNCDLSPCSGTWKESTAITDAFQAVLIAGDRERIQDRREIPDHQGLLEVGRTAPTAPPPPPAPPAATPGHYTGKTADNELFAFDIGADGLSLSNLQTGQMNESCNPPGSLSGGNIRAAGPFPVAKDGSFTLTGSFVSVVGSSASQNTITITGHVSAGIASGTYKEDTLFAANGVNFSCTTGQQSWTASKV